MRGKKAKRIRRIIYGDFSVRGRKSIKNPETGQIAADQLRRKYQIAKRISEMELGAWQLF